MRETEAYQLADEIVLACRTKLRERSAELYNFLGWRDRLWKGLRQCIVKVLLRHNHGPKHVPWEQRMREATKQNKGKLPLDKIIALAKNYTMTEDELRTQQQSFVKGQIELARYTRAARKG